MEDFFAEVTSLHVVVFAEGTYVGLDELDSVCLLEILSLIFREVLLN